MLETSFSIYHLEFYLCAFVRIAGTIGFSPFFSNRSVPRRLRIGMSLCIALIMVGIVPYTPLEYTSLFGFTFILLKELMTGIIIGFIANVCLTIVSLAGMIIDREIGFAMAQVFDPVTNVNTTVTAEFYNYIILLIMLCTNMHHFIISAISDSFSVIPVGGAKWSQEGFYLVLLRYITDYFVIAIRIALPIFICILLLNVILGVLAKSAPQMNMFSVGMQLKVICGLLLVIATVIFLPNITDFLYFEMQEIVNQTIRSMY